MQIWMKKQGIFWNFKIQEDHVIKNSERNLVIVKWNKNEEKIQMIYINKSWTFGKKIKLY